MLLVATAAAATFAIVHATVLPIAGPPVEDGTVVVTDGKIVAVGKGLAPPAGAEVVDGTGKFVTPGLVDLHSHMGVYSWPGGQGNSDGNEMVEPFTPRVWAGDAFDPEDPAIARGRAGGLTTMQVLPGSGNMIGGQAAIVKLRPARTIEQMAFAGAPRSIKMACGENPKRVYGGEDEHDVKLMTRMGEIAALRGVLQRAVEYKAARASKAPPPKDLDLEVLVDVLEGEVRVNLHCYRSFDIDGWYRVADDYGFRITTIHHALETYKVRDLLAAHGTGIATWPDWWGFKMEAWDGIPWGPKLVAEAGVLVATHSDSPSHAQRLNLEAAKLVRYGMSEEEALKTITLNPAKLLGVDARVGTIEPGKDADLVLWSKHPLDGYTLATMTWIDGVLVYDRAKEGNPDGRR
ncbi:MAG: amidohydrolase [Myxococcota bacterium]